MNIWIIYNMLIIQHTLHHISFLSFRTNQHTILKLQMSLQHVPYHILLQTALQHIQHILHHVLHHILLQIQFQHIYCHMLIQNVSHYTYVCHNCIIVCHFVCIIIVSHHHFTSIFIIFCIRHHHFALCIINILHSSSFFIRHHHFAFIIILRSSSFCKI